jgi:hypothetical protein
MALKVPVVGRLYLWFLIQKICTGFNYIIGKIAMISASRSAKCQMGPCNCNLVNLYKPFMSYLTEYILINRFKYG